MGEVPISDPSTALSPSKSTKMRLGGVGEQRVDAQAGSIWLVPVVLPLLSGQEDQGRRQTGWKVVQVRWPQRQMEEQPDLKVCQGGMRIRQLWGEPCGQADPAALGLRPHQGGL